MSDALTAISALTTLLQAASAATAAAEQVSAILVRMQTEGRDSLTAEEWAQLDEYVASARARALDA